jgi:hypothetical protein
MRYVLAAVAFMAMTSTTLAQVCDNNNFWDRFTAGLRQAQGQPDPCAQKKTLDWLVNQRGYDTQTAAVIVSDPVMMRQTMLQEIQKDSQKRR